jgi:hypothetical protein
MGTLYDVNSATGQISADNLVSKTTDANLNLGANGAGIIVMNSDVSNSTSDYLISDATGVATFDTATLTSTTRGFLTPRMTTAQRDAIATPADALLIWNTTTDQYNVYIDSQAAWVILAPAVNATHTTTWSGIWAAAQSGNVAYTQLDKQVSVTIPDLSAAATTASFITMDTAFPANLWPTNPVVVPVFVFDNQASPNSIADASCLIDSESGVITIYGSRAIGSTFSGLSEVGNSGVRGIVITYLSV